MSPKDKSAGKRSEKVPRSYLEVSRGWPASLLFMLPLLVLYEAGVAYLHTTRAHSGAADWVKGKLGLFGGMEALIFNLVVIVGVIAAIAYLAGRKELRFYVFPLMLVESVAYAAALLLVKSPVMRAASALFQPPAEGAAPLSLLNVGAKWSAIFPEIVSSAGAGLYEEVLFRGVLITALFFLLARALRMGPVAAGTLSILASAVLFSLMHFVGRGGEPFLPQTFAFRLVAGLFLSAVFIGRGLGIACYTHALFNILTILPPLARLV